MHLWMTALMPALLNLMIFRVGILDDPYSGEVSISSPALEIVYSQAMTGR